MVLMNYKKWIYLWFLLLLCFFSLACAEKIPPELQEYLTKVEITEISKNTLKGQCPELNITFYSWVSDELLENYHTGKGAQKVEVRYDDEKQVISVQDDDQNQKIQLLSLKTGEPTGFTLEEREDFFKLVFSLGQRKDLFPTNYYNKPFFYLAGLWGLIGNCAPDEILDYSLKHDEEK